MFLRHVIWSSYASNDEMRIYGLSVSYREPLAITREKCYHISIKKVFHDLCFINKSSHNDIGETSVAIVVPGWTDAAIVLQFYLNTTVNIYARLL
jgi:hypothetical protein